MKPIPPEIVARWSATWAAGVYPSRPWWYRTPERVVGDFLSDVLFHGAAQVIDPDRYVRRGGGILVIANHLPLDRKRAARLSDPVAGWLVCIGDPMKPESYTHPADRPDGFETAEAAMAWCDTAHPLPAPMPLPMQVWRWAEGDETMIVRVAPAGADGVVDVWRVWTCLNGVGVLVSPRAVSVDGGSRVEQWPPPGAILVAGPSPHGFNVPWSGS